MTVMSGLLILVYYHYEQMSYAAIGDMITAICEGWKPARSTSSTASSSAYANQSFGIDNQSKSTYQSSN